MYLRVAKDDPNAWAPDTNMGDLDEVPDLQFWSYSALGIETIWAVSEWIENLPLPLSVTLSSN